MTSDAGGLEYAWLKTYLEKTPSKRVMKVEVQDIMSPKMHSMAVAKRKPPVKKKILSVNVPSNVKKQEVVGVGVPKKLETVVLDRRTRMKTQTAFSSEVERRTDIFSRLQLSNCPKLTTINLKISKSSDPVEEIVVNNVFNALEQFRETLIEVHLEFDYSPTFFLASTINLNVGLDKLKRFSMKYLVKKCSDLIPVNVLEYAKASLQQLSITVSMDNSGNSDTNDGVLSLLEAYDEWDENRKPCITFYSRWNSMYRANVWKSFPKLRKIYFRYSAEQEEGSCIFTRVEYLKYKAEREARNKEKENESTKMDQIKQLNFN